MRVRDLEKPMCISVGEQRLFGILHLPAKGAPAAGGTGLVFINAGLRYRIGPYRQYVKYARRFCRAGHAVLRFDSSGIGDSEGHFRDISQFRRDVVEDAAKTACAVEFLRAEAGVERIGLFGMCSGAYDALLSGASLPQITFAILVSLPVEDPDGSLPEGIGRFQEIGQWQSLWMKSAQAIAACRTQGKKLHFIFGENDCFYRAFQAQLHKMPVFENTEASFLDIRTVSGADHVFSLQKWQDALAEGSLQWLAGL